MRSAECGVRSKSKNENLKIKDEEKFTKIEIKEFKSESSRIIKYINELETGIYIVRNKNNNY